MSNFTFTERQNLIYALEQTIALLMTGWVKVSNTAISLDRMIQLHRDLGGDVKFNRAAYETQRAKEDLDSIAYHQQRDEL